MSTLEILSKVQNQTWKGKAARNGFVHKCASVTSTSKRYANYLNLVGKGDGLGK